jgi:hypothetical protein
VIDTCRSVAIYYAIVPVVWHAEHESVQIGHVQYSIECTLPAGHDGPHEGRTAEGRVIRWR